MTRQYSNERSTQSYLLSLLVVSRRGISLGWSGDD